MVRSPLHDRNRSLGWLSTAWCEYFVRHGPGAIKGQPVRHGDEYSGFLADCYALGDDPLNAHMLYDSVFLSRPKGVRAPAGGCSRGPARLLRLRQVRHRRPAGAVRGHGTLTVRRVG